MNATIAARTTATTGDTSAATLSAVRAAYGSNAITLVAGTFPFTAQNLTFGRNATLAMISRRSLAALKSGSTADSIRLANTILLGSGADTLRIAVDSTQWLPGDRFAILEAVSQDSTNASGAVVVGGNGQPIQVTHNRVSFAPAIIACSSRPSCNPIATTARGATGYLTYPAGTQLQVTYEAPFVPGSQFTVTVTGVASANTFTSADRAKIRVVPNPYVAQDQYDVVTNRRGTSRVYFSNVPQSGQLRIYSVSGQFLQELTWSPSDLNGTGDLPYDLRTREGTDLASGLYIWTIRAFGASGKTDLARGKFVVIR